MTLHLAKSTFYGNFSTFHFTAVTNNRDPPPSKAADKVEFSWTSIKEKTLKLFSILTGFQGLSLKRGKGDQGMGRGNEERGTRNGDWGTGNGESLKRGIFKMGIL